MVLWREECANRLPPLLSVRNLAFALVLHLCFFFLLWLYSVSHNKFASKDEEIVPIDLTVVVVENLDGNDDEPPPVKPKTDPPPPSPPSPPEQPMKPDKPKELEKIVTNVVEKPEVSRKTAQQLREERKRRMLESAKTVDAKTTVVTVRQPNGRTERRLQDWEKLLREGYRPSSANNLATSEMQRGLSLIKMAFEEKWDQPPWTDTLKPMTIRVWFGNGGKVMRYQLESSSGDRRADDSIQSAASRVDAVPGLSAAFIDKYRAGGVAVRFTVRPM